MHSRIDSEQCRFGKRLLRKEAYAAFSIPDPVQNLQKKRHAVFRALRKKTGFSKITFVPNDPAIWKKFRPVFDEILELEFSICIA